jgi:hypothetical protein
MHAVTAAAGRVVVIVLAGLGLGGVVGGVLGGFGGLVYAAAT